MHRSVVFGGVFCVYNGKELIHMITLVRRGLFINCMYRSVDVNKLGVRMSAIVVWLRIRNLEVFYSVPLSINPDASCFIYSADVRMIQ